MDPFMLLCGVRDRLQANGVGPVVIGPLQGNGPCVGLTWVPLIDDPTTGDVLAGVQVRTRGDAKAGAQPLLDRQEDIFSVLTFEDTEIGGVVVAACWRQTSAPMHLDSQGRPEVFDTFYLRTDR